jgi:hypothetical protein
MFRIKGTFLILVCSVSFSDAFLAPPRSKIDWSLGPGGWGIGTPNDMREEEFSRKKSSVGRRRKQVDGNPSSDDIAYSAERNEKFAFEDPMAFTQRVQREKNNLELAKKQDLFEIAKIAGLSDRLKPKSNAENESTYGRFDLDEEDDDLDVRVY